MRNLARTAPLDLASLERLYRRGDVAPRDVVSCVLERIHAYPDPAVWIHLFSPEKVLEQADAAALRRRAGEALPLYGVPFAVKDNIDVAGCPTTAGCPAFAYTPERTAVVVDRLLNAGAVLIGKTNLDQFAAGLAGDRTPYGACRNVFDPCYISGGSSSGSAVAVASGLVSFALGTDTAGSGRVPAGCNNIVGLKPTRGRLPTDGVVPACRSLDCVSIFALRAEDAFSICQVGADEALGAAPSSGKPTGFTFAVPQEKDLEFYGDKRQADLFRQASAGLEMLGTTRRETVDFAPFREVASLLYDGPWIAERLASLKEFVRDHASDMHPVTRAVLARGRDYSAVDVFKAMHRLASLRSECLKIFQRAELLMVPTLPALPTRAEVEADSAGWSRRLGHYTNFVNLLELAAIAVPAGFSPDGLPAGITLIGKAGSERRLCEIGAAWQQWTKLPLGATRSVFPKDEEPVRMEKPLPAGKGMVRVAVAGAHLSGQPLHKELLQCGARFVRSCRTASRYRFLALMDLKPPRPGLLRDQQRGGAAAVEIYDLSTEGFGALVASVAAPLAIGTIELEDGEAVKGFLCESFAAAHARDITDFGGWVAFREATA